jgi:hypothetical protein
MVRNVIASLERFQSTVPYEGSAVWGAETRFRCKGGNRALDRVLVPVANVDRFGIVALYMRKGLPGWWGRRRSSGSET